MDGRYDHRRVEEKWSRQWREQGAYAVDLDNAARPYYNLMMFPYPSAEGLHIGNFFAFVGSDVHGRYMRSQGYDVFEPMGFDAFGIHSENHALKTGTHPSRLIPANVAHFRRQLERIGARFDWGHEVNSTDPAYYRWTQWIFLQLFKAGLAYQKLAPVNWCPACRTVLADEQASGGSCERCDSEVEQRDMRQWFFRITAYAQRLLDNLDWIDWSDITRTAQRQWIGRSEGAEVVFPVTGSQHEITVFTTRPDTLWGATYVVLAPEHPLVEQIASAGQKGEVEEYAHAARRKSMVERQDATRQKSGVFTGAHATNPANGQRLPVWVADYVLMGYGTGAIMAVPAHDARDFEFAEQFGLPIVEVISPDGEEHVLAEAYVGEGTLIHSGPFSGMGSREAMGEIGDWLATQGRGKATVIYRLRDWCVSRQRYWGPPIPIVHCDHCGAVPVPEKDLPVLLPHLEEFAPDGSGRSPLARDRSFVEVDCPQCARMARRETDVSDNFLDSAWYFYRYPSSDRDHEAFGEAMTRKWLPVDMYIGGNEHAALHLMYARFLSMALKDLGVTHIEEPFRRFRAHGIIVKDGAKMSKSKGNVINPDTYLDQYGADTFRTFLMFLGPFQQGGDFRDRGIVGVQRFYERLWRHVTTADFVDCQPPSRELTRLIHSQVAKVTLGLEELRYNTAVAALMELLNGLLAAEQPCRQGVEILLQLTCPFAPFITQELWEQLGQKGYVNDARWPSCDGDLVEEDMVEWVVQVNGKIRERLDLPAGAPQSQVEKMALSCERIRGWTTNREVVKMIFVPDKLLNIVVA